MMKSTFGLPAAETERDFDFVAALAETANQGSDGRSSKMDFLVSNLSHSSPAMGEVTAISLDNSESPEKVVSNLLDIIRGAMRRTIDADASNAKLVD